MVVCKFVDVVKRECVQWWMHCEVGADFFSGAIGRYKVNSLADAVCVNNSKMRISTGVLKLRFYGP